MRNWFYEVVLLTLVVLVGVAIWQFYSLAWGEGLNGGYTAGKQPLEINNLQPTPAARPVPK